jgi:hypothetical protein
MTRRKRAGGRAETTPAGGRKNAALWDALAALGFREGTPDDPAVFLWLIMTGRVLEPAPRAARQRAARSLLRAGIGARATGGPSTGSQKPPSRGVPATSGAEDHL